MFHPPALRSAPRSAPRSTSVSYLIDHVAVVIPARDEAHHIGDTIRSVQIARRSLSPTVTCGISVVADSCDDATLTAALSLLDPSRDLAIAATYGAAGAARRAGTSAALDRTPTTARRVWIANTDADTVVDDDWLTRQLDHAAGGAVGVAGIVRLNEHRIMPSDLALEFCKAYAVADDHSHTHVHGANLGFLAAAYEDVGGWNTLATGEDHDLWRRLRTVGTVVSDARICVSTDPRTVGRAPDGFARDLARLAGAA